MADRIVVVTGASGALGDAVTKVFLDAGDVVYGISRSGGKRTDLKYHPVAADLSSATVAREVTAHIVRTTQRIDVLVHTIGAFAGGKNLVETDDDTWKNMLDLNLNAAFYVLRAVLPHMKSGGRVIAVGSRAGVLPAAKSAAYNVSKAGLNML